MSLGARLRELRLRQGLSQRALADVVGVGFPHVSKVEAGREAPSEDLLRKLAVELDADLDELLLLANRVSDELRETVAAKPHLAPRFLRSWRDGSIRDEDVEALLRESKRRR